MGSRAVATSQRLQQVALEKFAARGFDAVTVAEIARSAGVSHMTFFRHFPTKEAVIAQDVFDPMIARSVAAQPGHLPPLHRAVHGMVAALELPQARAHLRSDAFRTRLRLAGSTPALRAAVARSGEATEDAIAQALTTSAVPARAARAAAGAVMGASTAVLWDWSRTDDGGTDPATILADELGSLLGGPS